jgi:trimeric autotransporter adhesin
MNTKNMTTSRSRNLINPSPLRRDLILIPLVLAAFALSPTARAACREGCSDTSTFLGDDALLNNTTGVGNTAIGWQALFENTTGFGNTASGFTALHDNTTGGSNTAAGDGALFSNTTGSSNTATGANALLFNMTGDNNTASGEGAMQNCITGSNNTANGFEALFGDSPDRLTGSFNTANGVQALFSNTTGGSNTASGYLALFSNTTGSFNAADGANALQSNTTGGGNVANGGFALFSNTTGVNNVAEGFDALIDNTTGDNNIAIGLGAGGNLTTGSNNIDIGALGMAGEGNTIRIGTQGTQTKTFVAGISGAVVRGVPVKVNAAGQLGTTPSSARFKQNIKPMDKASETIHALKPVTFRYKKEIDPTGTSQFGLVAEEVEKVNPDLVVRDEEGKAYSVCYEAVNAMLLNEFLKEHRKVEQQEATIAQLRKGMEGLIARLKEQDSKIQELSDQVELSKPAPQTVLNNQ